MEYIRKYTRVILNIVIPLLMILLICLLGPKLLRFFLPFVIGWIIAMIANPLVRFLERRVKILRKHSSVLVIVAAIAAVVGLGYFLLSKLVIEAIGLAQELPQVYETIALEIEAFAQRFSGLLQMVPEDVQGVWQDFAEHMGQWMGTLMEMVATPTIEVAGSAAKALPNVLVNVTVTILSAYFFIADRDQVVAFWRRYLPASGNLYLDYMRADVKHLLSGYFLAQFKIMFVIAMILFIGFLALGIHYAFLLAILTAMVDFLPIFGTGTILIPWALIEVLTGGYPLAIGLAVLYLATLIVRQVIQPKIVGDSLGLPPMVTLVLLYLGFKLGGISGMILAVPIGIFVANIYHYGAFDSLIENTKILIHDLEAFRKGKD